ncbi:MAG: DUF6288 domain-containing protein [Planctomycetota bacterium]|nr:DUF6288 domain-containing protein [Planctomycetota bacterium]
MSLCLAALLLPTLSAGASEWPFGKARGFGMRGGDYYNLGLIGAKARDADAQAPQTQDMGGGMRRGGAARPTHDRGPLRLEVVLLFPEGPGEKAGLAKGDVIVGVGRKAFQEGSLEPLAEALVKAESGAKKGILTLLVERDGKREKLAIAIPQGGKEASKPLKAKARKAVIAKALAFLDSKQASSGGFAQTLSGANGAVVQTAVAGLAWLAAGNDLEQGAYKENVTKAVEFVSRWCARPGEQGMGGGMADPRMQGRGNWNQNNWGFAHAAIFLGEVHARTPTRDVKQALANAAKALLDAQEESGGWAHGPGGPNGLGYVELNIVTGLALCGLGMAQKSGYEVPEEAIEKAEAYLKASSSGDGGIGYSDKPGQRGQGNIGRSAAAMLGYGVLGLGKSGWGAKMRKYVERTADKVLGGHASLMQHILLAGVGANAAGKSAVSKFWKALERDLILARAPDGSFQPRPWHESLSMGSNSDVTFGQIWTTAAWTVVLACAPQGPDHPGLPAWLGR